ncbi:MAG: hypothetical protein Q8L09_03780 [Candidatus Moranbacteria bacterium]|nr:hypothetical protein [Candidatus Moranbacteria bacterium]
MEASLGKIYKIIRILIYLIPVVVVIVGLYLVFFPVEKFAYLSGQPKLSKFDIRKDTGANELSFGVFPLKKNNIINLDVNLKKTEKKSCKENLPVVSLERTYQAFLYPAGPDINSQDELRNLLYIDNSTKYSNGTLLHNKPTDRVFLISHGKKILFPGPEILLAFGYGFDYMVDVDQSVIDQYPEADEGVFLWTLPHPDGIIFESFPTHSFYLILNGQKRLITDPNFMDKAWPEHYSIPVNDITPANRSQCQISAKDYTNGNIKCAFYADNLPVALGKYYLFTLEYQDVCLVENIHINNALINFRPAKSYATIKDTIRTIFASILNRYIQK